MVKENGFTLIELLVVVSIISILFVMVVTAIDPVQRFKTARDSRRMTDVTSIITAIHQYTIDSKGMLPDGLSNGMVEVQLGKAIDGCEIITKGCNAAVSSCLDLSANLSRYLISVPEDPNGGTIDKTKYTVSINSDGILTVKACGAEKLPKISFSR